jgi:hypothetical protein
VRQLDAGSICSKKKIVTGVYQVELSIIRSSLKSAKVGHKSVLTVSGLLRILKILKFVQYGYIKDYYVIVQQILQQIDYF